VFRVEIVIPVRDEQRELTSHVTRLAGYLRDHFPRQIAIR
jgi:hypothetical protein